MKKLKMLLSAILSTFLLVHAVPVIGGSGVIFASETVQEEAFWEEDVQEDGIQEDTLHIRAVQKESAQKDAIQEEDAVTPEAPEQETDFGPDPDFEEASVETSEEKSKEGLEEISGEKTDEENAGDGLKESSRKKADELNADDEIKESSGEEVEKEANDGVVIVEVPGDEEIWIPTEEDDFVNVDSDADHDDIFAAYVNRELSLEGSLQADTGDYYVTEPARKSNYASTRLSGYNRTIYGVLLGKIRKVAAGELSSTVLTVSLDELGLSEYEKSRWTAADLGVDTVRTTNSSGKSVVPDEAQKALLSLLNIDSIDLKELHSALLADCPYDLYWYDKVSGVSRSMFSLYKYTDGTYKLAFSPEWKYSFKVAAEYSADGEKGTYKTKPNIGMSVQSAHANALAIVEEYKDKSDYEKLDGYRQEILDRVDYNSEAASSSATAYGNPWQLIWTFDDDPETKVVCEGYSKSFQYLCDLTSWNSIFRECVSVTGNLYGPNGGSSGLHMWNIVTLRDGRNYLADLTNCDTGHSGAGNGGRNLFLVGTGDFSVDKAFGSGNAEDGYTFPALSSRLHYYYDSKMFDNFGAERLALAAGKVTEDTVADGEYDGNHEHLYLSVEKEAASCTSAGRIDWKCAICGDSFQEEIPVLPHTPGAWTVDIEPTYDTKGLAKTSCTVCGTEMEKEIPELISVTDFSLEEESITIVKGDTQTLHTHIVPEDAYDQGVVWDSEDDSIATVSSSGAVRGMGNGTTYVTSATAFGDGAFRRSCRVTVITPVTGVKMDIAELELTCEETASLAAVVSPIDASNLAVSWSSSDERIASVDQEGKVTAVGKGTAVIFATTEDGEFRASCGVTVNPFSIEEMSISLSSAAFTYDGTAKEPAVTVFSNELNRALTAGKDYTISYSDNINAGTAKAVITACEGTAFDGSVSRSFKIGTFPLTQALVSVNAKSLAYDGSKKTPAVTVTAGGSTLVSGRDYTLTYSNNINAGTNTASVTVTGKGNYSGSVKKLFSIAKAAQKPAVSAKAAVITAGQTTTVTVSGAKGTKAFTSSDKTVATVNAGSGLVTAKKAGTVKITVNCAATGNYSAAVRSVTIKVLPPATSKLTASNLDGGIKLSWAKVDGANGYDLYRSGDSEPFVSFLSGSILSYTDPYAKTNGKTYTYSVVPRASSGPGKYKKSVTLCRLSTPTVKSLKNSASGRLALAWGKNAKASGYQIQYSLSKAFPAQSTKTIAIGKADTTARTISGLKKGKVWYVRIRAYKTPADGKKYYSAWKTVHSSKLK